MSVFMQLTVKFDTRPRVGADSTGRTVHPDRQKRRRFGTGSLLPSDRRVSRAIRCRLDFS
ncbi:hypothetical protein F01_520099 [Burkholderia cenocepacia]|nr:hypothetical protein F01_520099 [Burkholderia cenocepacia]